MSTENKNQTSKAIATIQNPLYPQEGVHNWERS